MEKKEKENYIQFGIKLACDLLDINRIRYEYADLSKTTEEARAAVPASFIKEHNIILINPDILKALDFQAKNDDETNSLLIIGIMFHEVMHAYQFIKNPSLFEYAKKFTDKDYLNQEIEIEAYGFQLMILRFLFDNENLSINVNDGIAKDKIKAAALEFSKKYESKLIVLLSKRRIK